MDKEILKMVNEHLKYEIFNSQDFDGILTFVEKNLQEVVNLV